MSAALLLERAPRVGDGLDPRAPGEPAGDDPRVTRIFGAWCSCCSRWTYEIDVDGVLWESDDLPGFYRGDLDGASAALREIASAIAPIDADTEITVEDPSDHGVTPW